MPKERREGATAALRHDPLEKQLADDGARGVVPSKKKKRRNGADADDDAEYMSSALSRKTLELAREQQAEISMDAAPHGGNTSAQGASAAAAAFSGGIADDSDAESDDDMQDGGGGSMVRFRGDVVEAAEEPDEHLRTRGGGFSGWSCRRSLLPLPAPATS